MLSSKVIMPCRRGQVLGAILLTGPHLTSILLCFPALGDQREQQHHTQIDWDVVGASSSFVSSVSLLWVMSPRRLD